MPLMKIQSRPVAWFCMAHPVVQRRERDCLSATDASVRAAAGDGYIVRLRSEESSRDAVDYGAAFTPQTIRATTAIAKATVSPLMEYISRSDIGGPLAVCTFDGMGSRQVQGTVRNRTKFPEAAGWIRATHEAAKLKRPGALKKVEATRRGSPETPYQRLRAGT
jgi:hypothetical protein